jgi:hypothetical protein
MIVAMAKRGPKNPLSNEHKAAMAAGRKEGRAVRDYLDAIRLNKPKPGRPRTPERMKERLAAIEVELNEATSIDELRLLQERRDLQAALTEAQPATDMAALEERFVEVAKSYSTNKGISYATWREFGVSAAVLSRAGVGRR